MDILLLHFGSHYQLFNSRFVFIVNFGMCCLASDTHCRTYNIVFPFVNQFCISIIMPPEYEEFDIVQVTRNMNEKTILFQVMGEIEIFGDELA